MIHGEFLLHPADVLSLFFSPERALTFDSLEYDVIVCVVPLVVNEAPNFCELTVPPVAIANHNLDPGPLALRLGFSATCDVPPIVFFDDHLCTLFDSKNGQVP